MRAIKAFVVIVAVLIGGFAWTMPAFADGETITGHDTTYTPGQDKGGSGLQMVKFDYSSVFTIHVVATFGGQPFAMTSINGCTGGGGSYVCNTGGTNVSGLTFAVTEGSLQNAAEKAGTASPTLTVVATADSTTVTATSHIFVKPQADLAITASPSATTAVRTVPNWSSTSQIPDRAGHSGRRSWSPDITRAPRSRSNPGASGPAPRRSRARSIAASPVRPANRSAFR